LSQELERVYTINLGKVLLTPNNQRAKRAINVIKEFARHHMKTEQIKIEEDLSHIIWKRGIKHPPRKIRVKMTKSDEGFILVTPYDESELTEAPVPEKPKSEEEKVIPSELEKKPEIEVDKIAESKQTKTKEPEAKKPKTKETKAPKTTHKEPKTTKSKKTTKASDKKEPKKKSKK